MDLGLLDLGDEGGGREVVPDEADVAAVVGDKPDGWCMAVNATRPLRSGFDWPSRGVTARHARGGGTGMGITNAL